MIDVKQDKQVQKGTKKKLKGKLPQVFHDLIQQEDLTDVWRYKNPTSRDYTFYSNRHSTFSRLDMIWVSVKLLSLTKSIEIIPKIKSDHNPVIWTGKKEKKQFHWRINEEIFHHKEYINQIRLETSNFFRINKKEDTTLQIIWDAYKATIRGKLIAINVAKKKKEREKIQEIQLEIKKKEEELKRHPGKKKILREITQLRKNFDQEVIKETYWNLKKNQQKPFEFANKPGKLLANN